MSDAHPAVPGAAPEPAGVSSGRRARLLLACGAAAGLVMAAASLLSSPDAGRLPAGAVASVNGVPIREEEYVRLVAALASDRRSPLGDDDRRHVLDRLIEEELLVQHAVDLGLLHTDRRVRGDLVSAVLGSVGAAADLVEPSASELESFYADNADYFATPGRLWVREFFFANDGGDARGEAVERARRAAQRLRSGEDPDAVREALADTPVAELPSAPLPPAKLREYLGPTALSAALELAQGQVSDPVPTPQGYLVLLLVQRSEDRVRPLAEVEPQVRAEMRRRAGDRLLRERLDALRAQADVRVAPVLP